MPGNKVSHLPLTPVSHSAPKLCAHHSPAATYADCLMLLSGVLRRSHSRPPCSTQSSGLAPFAMRNRLRPVGCASYRAASYLPTAAPPSEANDNFIIFVVLLRFTNSVLHSIAAAHFKVYGARMPMKQAWGTAATNPEQTTTTTKKQWMLAFIPSGLVCIVQTGSGAGCVSKCVYVCVCAKGYNTSTSPSYHTRSPAPADTKYEWKWTEHCAR